MKRIVYIIAASVLLFATPLRVNGAENDVIDDKASNSNNLVTIEPLPTPSKSDSTHILIDISSYDKNPQFPGGDVALYPWIAQNIKYPPTAVEQGITGKVTVQFTIEKDGSVSNVKVVRGKHPDLDAEAVRLVKSMPKWQPAIKDGEPAECRYTLPVTFKL